MLARKAIVTALNAFIISNVLAAVFGGGVAIIAYVPGSSCGSQIFGNIVGALLGYWWK